MPGAKRKDARNGPGCARSRGAERPFGTDGAVATIGEAVDGGWQAGMPHSPGCLQWQQSHWQVFNGSTGCTCTTAAQKSAKRARTMRFIGLAQSWAPGPIGQLLFPDIARLGMIRTGVDVPVVPTECILFAGFSVAMCFDTRQLRDQIKRLNAEAPFALGSLTRRQTCSSDPVWRSKKCASYPNSRTSSSVCRPILRLRETGLPLALDWRNLESAGWRRVPPLSSDRFDRLTASARGGSREANNS